MSWSGSVIIGILAWAIIIAYFVNDISRKFVIWLIWDFSGLRFVWNKIRPSIENQPNVRPPATFMLWAFGIFGVYIALFGLASQRYENRIDTIEIRANAVLNQISFPESRQGALSQIAKVQNMSCPVQPNILMPFSVFESFINNQPYLDMVDLLKDTVVNWKRYLSSVNLKSARLQGADLNEANFQNANLLLANLGGSKLKNANFNKAYLDGIILSGADLIGASFQGAFMQKGELVEANLSGSNLESIRAMGSNFEKAYFGPLGHWQRFPKIEEYFAGANLQNANLKGTNFKEAKIISVNLEGANLSGANLQDAFIEGSNLQGVDLEEANFKGIVLSNVDLQGAQNLTIEQLSRAKTLYGTKLNFELKSKIEAKYPSLLIKPDSKTMGRWYHGW
jgi:uncharacterized protein YjbI with pentapeptide repeats